MKKLKNIYKAAVYLSLLLLILSIIITLFQNNDLNYYILRKTAEIGTYLLFIILLCKSIYFIMKEKNINNYLYRFLRYNNKYQREQGLIVFNIIFIHIIMISIMDISNIKLLIFYYITAIIPTIILVYMEVTSFKVFQTKIKRWKKHHSIIWMTIPFIYIHVLLVSEHDIRYLIFGLIVLLVALFETLIGLKRGIKHLFYLLIGLFISAVQLISINKYISLQNTSSDESSNNVQQTTGEAPVAQEEAVIEDPANTIYNDGTYTGQGYGHVGLIEVETKIKDDQIISIEVISENEDEPWWEPVISTLPDEVITNNSTEGVSYIAGSTHSSEGFLEAVDDSLDDAKISS